MTCTTHVSLRFCYFAVHYKYLVVCHLELLLFIILISLSAGNYIETVPRHALRIGYHILTNNVQYSTNL